ncbi:hypothetical protein AB4Z46_13070 [Variovorax sp. M-6]|uniref:hypothetical protein n=1 Tax=Variovorax sp. M-6 TaxID=3233041 RepID=UPI003F9E072D
MSVSTPAGKARRNIGLIAWTELFKGRRAIKRTMRPMLGFKSLVSFSLTSRAVPGRLAEQAHRYWRRSQTRAAPPASPASSVIVMSGLCPSIGACFGDEILRSAPAENGL